LFLGWCLVVFFFGRFAPPPPPPPPPPAPSTFIFGKVATRATSWPPRRRDDAVRDCLRPDEVDVGAGGAYVRTPSGPRCGDYSDDVSSWTPHHRTRSTAVTPGRSQSRVSRCASGEARTRRQTSPPGSAAATAAGTAASLPRLPVCIRVGVQSSSVTAVHSRDHNESGFLYKYTSAPASPLSLML
jgi:hypothetical protein